jgi:hypothetical protein
MYGPPGPSDPYSGPNYGPTQDQLGVQQFDPYQMDMGGFDPSAGYQDMFTGLY